MNPRFVLQSDGICTWEYQREPGTSDMSDRVSYMNVSNGRDTLSGMYGYTRAFLSPGSSWEPDRLNRSDPRVSNILYVPPVLVFDTASHTLSGLRTDGPLPWALINSCGAVPHPAGPLEFSLEGPYGVPIFFPHILFNIFAENNQRIVILFHAALRTFYARLEPFRDASNVKHVATLESLVGPFRLLKTHGTCL